MMEHESPHRELGSSCPLALNSMLDVVVTYVTDTLVAPSATYLAVSLFYVAHSEVERMSDYDD